MNLPKNTKGMLWIKILWVAVVTVPIAALVAYGVYRYLDNPNTGFRNSSRLQVEILPRMQNGISNPPAFTLLSPFTDLVMGVLDQKVTAALKSEEERYAAQYSFKYTGEGLYEGGSALQDRERLDESIEHNSMILDTSKTPGEIVQAQKEIEVMRAHREYFNTRNNCSIGLIWLTRWVQISDEENAVMRIALTPVSNESGTLLSLRLWHVEVLRSACLLPRWKDGIAMRLHLQLRAMIAGVDERLSHGILLDDEIEIPSIQVGRAYEHESLADFSSAWFPFPPKLEYVDVAQNATPATRMAGQDGGNYMLKVTVVESALP